MRIITEKNGTLGNDLLKLYFFNANLKNITRNQWWNRFV